jgi:hypothetical protein
MKMLRVWLHGFILATINIGFITISFRIYKLLTNEIAAQAPISAMFCIIVFATWSLFTKYLPFKWLVWKEISELIWVYCIAFFWSPLIFIPLHKIRWGYWPSVADIFSIWFFQLFVNLLTMFVVYLVMGSKQERTERTEQLVTKLPQFPLNNIALSVVSVVVTLLFAELGLQVFYRYLPPVAISGWRSFAHELENNQLGFRGQSLEYSDDDFVIVLIGDSQAEALACAYDWMPERRLEHHLNSFGKNVKVFTLAATGYGQDQQLLVLQEYYQTYRADMVVLWQTPNNDIWNNMFPTHWPTNGTPKPTFWLENGELRGPTEQIGEAIKLSRFKVIELWRRLFMPDRDEEWEKYFPPPYTPMHDYHGPVNTQWQELWDKDLGQLRYENLDTEKSHMAISLTPRSKRMEYGITLTRKLLQQIEKLVTSHNGNFVIFRTKKPSDDIEVDVNVYVLNGKYYKSLKKQREENIKKVNRGFRTYVIPIQVEHWMAGPQDAHLNEHAVDQVIRDLANSLKNLIPPSLHTSAN